MAHFAHLPNQAPPDCEEYHQGYGGVTISTPRLPEPLALYLQARDLHERVPEWELNLVLHSSLSGPGQVRIDNGARGVQRVYLSQLASGGVAVPLSLQSNAYTLAVSDDTPEDVRKRLAQPILGLMRGCAEAFRFSERKGRRLREGQCLYWGRAYFVLWHETLPIQFPPALPWTRELRSRGEWRCREVELPAEPAQPIQQWADRFFNRNVDHPPIRLTMVAPARAHRREDYSYEVPSDEDIILAITAERGAEPPKRLITYSTDARATRTISLEPSLPQFIRLGRLTRGYFHIYLADVEETELALVSADYEIPKLPSARIAATASDGEADVEIHSSKALNVFRKLLEGGGEIRRIEIPKRQRVEVTSDAGAFSTGFLPSSGGDEIAELESFHERLRDRLNQLLREQVRTIRIYAGNFGSVGVSIDAPPRQWGNNATLPMSILNRLTWLLGVREASVGQPLVDVTPSMTATKDNWTALLSHSAQGSLAQRAMSAFTAAVRWPAALVPHVRSVGSAIEQWTLDAQRAQIGGR